MTNKTNLTLVYQMGRVGSKSHEKVLKDNNLENVLHIHSLNQTRIINLNNNFTKLSIENYDPLHKLGISLGNKLLLEPHKFNVKTVCPIRDVISRNFSSFMYVDHFWQSKVRNKLKTTKELSEFFEMNFYHQDILNWCDSELFSILQQDVYNAVFKDDFIIIENSYGWKTLVYKFNIENKRKSELLSEFFKKDINFQANTNENKRENLWNNMTYEKIKENTHLSEHFIDRLHSSRYMNHFWTKKELDKIKNKLL